MESINHFSHKKHPLILKDLEADDGQEKVKCYGCKELISRGSKTYCCIECNVFLHKSCAELPLEITHPKHPEHPLQLSNELDWRTCNICSDFSNHFKYHCAQCNFIVDALCADLKLVDHKSHKHPLILMELEVDDDGPEKEKADCNCCKRPICSGPTYCCTRSRCKIFLHKSCAELPSTIMHPMHPEHPLELHTWVGNNGCNVCTRIWNAFGYVCEKCDFTVDVFCAQLKQDTFKHPCHPHFLQFQPRRAVFECNACRTEEEDESYYCTVCPFWIHKTCGSLASGKLFKGHPHPLDLACRFPEEYRHYNLSCEICHEKIKFSHWVYYCGPCRDFFHLKCITSWSEEDDPNCEEITPDTITLPTEYLVPQLIKLYVKQSGLDLLPLPQVELSSKIKLPSHKHPLISTIVNDVYYEFTEDDQETICNVCVEPIQGSCYSCDECNYYIHSYCAQLPEKVSYFAHPEHTLSLYYPPDIFSIRICTMCRRLCNGFMYECKECNFEVDLNCAFLPAKVKHKDHKHLLSRGASCHWYYCKACGKLEYDYFFICEICKYALARGCLILPQTMEHRWDKHPLILSFPPFHYHPLEITCDICEEEGHPKFWLYHCRKCDNSFHPNCMPRTGYNQNIKFGDKLKIDYHPHPLTLSRDAKYTPSCHKCKDFVYDRMTFECEDCYFNICVTCVSEIVGLQ